MAKNEIDIIISVKNFAKKELNNVTKRLQKLGNTIKSMALKAGIAFTALTASILKFAAAAQKQQEAINGLNQALKNQGNFTEETSKKLQEYATQLQRVTLFGDENIIKAQALFASFGLEEEQIIKLTKVTADLAQAKGMDLVAAADLVSKSVGSSTNALSRYGIEVKGSVGSTERINMAIENMNKLFAGQAEASAKGLGAISQFKNLLGDLAEEIGFALEPMLLRVVKVLKRLVIFFTDNKPLVKWTARIIALATAVSGLIVILGGLVTILPILLGPIGLISVAISGLSFIFFKFRKEIIGGLLISIKAVIVVFQGLIDKFNKVAKFVPGIPVIKVDTSETISKLDALIEKFGALKDAKINADNEMLASEEKRLAKEAELAAKKADEEKKATVAKKKGQEKQGKDFEEFSSFIAQAANSKNKEVAAVAKSLAIYQIGVDSYKAAMSAYSAMAGIPVIGPALGLAAGAAALAFGANQASEVSAQKPAFERGGIVPGNSFSGDNVDVRANSGEAILTQDQQKNLLDIASGNLAGNNAQDLTVILRVENKDIAHAVVQGYNTGRNLDLIPKLTGE